MVPFADLFSFSFLFSCSLGPVQTAPSLAGGGGMAVGVPALPQYGRIRDWVDIFTPTLTAVLYQSAEWLTLKGFPNRPRHDSRWQTEGVCHRQNCALIFQPVFAAPPRLDKGWTRSRSRSAPS